MNNYCCAYFEDEVYDHISVAIYPSGTEYHLINDDARGNVRIYYCPFCGKSLE